MSSSVSTTKPDIDLAVLPYSISELVKYDYDDADKPFNFEYILPESLESKSFVVCVGECKSEGIWMMTGIIFPVLELLREIF